MARIYISSTFEDLKDERRRVSDAILSVGHHPVRMEDYAAAGRPPLEKCLEDVRSCQIYIGIVAFCYGGIPSGQEKSQEKSFTALECEAAERAGLKRLIFLLDQKANWPVDRVDKDRQRIDAFRKELGDTLLCSFFSSPDDLAAKVILALQGETGKTSRGLDELPFLCDRSEQEFALEEAIGRLRTRPRRPLVCVVHGDEEQSHDMFLKRLQKISLPRLLEIPSERAVIEAHQIEWPTSFQGMAELHRKLTLSLAEKVLRRSTGARDDIAQRLARTPAPVLVHTHVLTEDWQMHGQQILDGFLDYWRSWPDVLGSQPLFAFLFLKYRIGRKSHWFRRRKLRKLKEEIAATLGDLDLTEVDDFTGKVLPLLDSVRRREAEDWGRSEETSRHCRVAEMVKEIGELFDRWESEMESDRIPMDKLAENLHILLQKLNRPAEEKMA